MYVLSPGLSQLMHISLNKFLIKPKALASYKFVNIQYLRNLFSSAIVIFSSSLVSMQIVIYCNGYIILYHK